MEDTTTKTTKKEIVMATRSDKYRAQSVLIVIGIYVLTWVAALEFHTLHISVPIGLTVLLLIGLFFHLKWRREEKALDKEIETLEELFKNNE